MRKYHIITYGCQMNEHDSENIAGLLEAMDYEYIDDPYKADVTVINTCSVRENADKRFFGTLGQMVQMYEAQGADFSEATTDVEKLEVIEAWEDAMNEPDLTPSPEERIASALEFQNVMSMPVVNDDDPDEEEE